MNYIDFMKRLNNKELKGIYLIYSKEDYLKDNIIQNLKNDLNNPDFNFINYKENTDYERIKTDVETYPILDTNKYIVWQDVDFSKNNIKNYDNILNNMIKDIYNFPNYSSLFIFSNQPIFKGKFYKEIEKKANIVIIEKLNRKELINFIGKKFKREGKKIKLDFIDIIIDSLSYFSNETKTDLYLISNTVDKIISNSQNTIVSREDINEQLKKIVDVNIFQLTDYLSSKQINKATITLENMIKSNEDLFMVFHMLARHTRNLIGIKFLSDKGFSENTIMSILKVSYYEYKKDIKYVNNFTIDRLLYLHELIYNIDIKSKSTNFDINKNIELFVNRWE